jgi:hypothetical protein
MLGRCLGDVRERDDDERGLMANAKLVSKLLAGFNEWNTFVQHNPTVEYDFTDADLSDLGSLLHYRFIAPANFSRTKLKTITGQPQFDAGACFDGASIQETATIDAVGRGLVTFRNVRFNGETSIQSSSSLDLDFTGATFLGHVRLTHSFVGKLTMDGADLQSGLVARDVAFFSNASFRRMYVAKSGRDFDLDLKGCKFLGAANFGRINAVGGVRISGCEFSARTNFRGAIFWVAPAFHGSKFHAETVFDVPERFDDQFRDVRSDRAEARYRTLKLRMSEHHAIAEQNAFGRLELKSRARQLGPFWFFSVFGPYELFADYGTSWIRPLGWFLV